MKMGLVAMTFVFEKTNYPELHHMEKETAGVWAVSTDACILFDRPNMDASPYTDAASLSSRFLT